MSNESNRPDLLNIPPELRLQIYEQVVLTEIECTVVRYWKDTYYPLEGFKSEPQLEHESKLNIPWLNLMLVCKMIAWELQSFMEAPSFFQDDRNTEYVVETRCHGRFLGATRWKQIPCPPSQARTLSLSYDRGRRTSRATTRSVIQAIYRFIECGPLFDSRFRLGRLPHIEQVRIRVDKRIDQAENEETVSEEGTWKQINIMEVEAQLIAEMTDHTEHGGFRGLVDNIVFCHSGARIKPFAAAD